MMVLLSNSKNGEERVLPAVNIEFTYVGSIHMIKICVLSERAE
jgi:hypothetical protein